MAKTAKKRGIPTGSRGTATSTRQTANQKAKGKPISLRLDSRTRFAIEFMARVKGQSITMVVERAITEAAGNAVLQTPEGQNLHWTDFWDTSEGVRTVRLISQPSYPSTQGEEELRDFIWAHRAFFFLDRPRWQDEPHPVPSRHFIEVLWPDIDEYAFIWTETKFSDHWAAGRAMVRALEAAGLKPPEWPPREKGGDRRG